MQTTAALHEHNLQKRIQQCIEEGWDKNDPNLRAHAIWTLQVDRQSAIRDKL